MCVLFRVTAPTPKLLVIVAFARVHSLSFLDRAVHTINAITKYPFSFCLPRNQVHSFEFLLTVVVTPHPPIFSLPYEYAQALVVSVPVFCMLIIN